MFLFCLNIAEGGPSEFLTESRKEYDPSFENVFTQVGYTQGMPDIMRVVNFVGASVCTISLPTSGLILLPLRQLVVSCDGASKGRASEEGKAIGQAVATSKLTNLSIASIFWLHLVVWMAKKVLSDGPKNCLQPSGR